MFMQFTQSGLCHSPLFGEGTELRPEQWSQYRDSQTPFVSEGVGA